MTLRDIRRTNVLSLRDLASKSGVSKTTLVHLEAGRRPPHPSTIRKLAAALTMEPRELLSQLTVSPAGVSQQQRDVRKEAEAFVRGEYSTVQLHRALSEHSTPIASELEGDLWGLVFEVGDGEIAVDEARQWLANKHGIF